MRNLLMLRVLMLVLAGGFLIYEFILQVFPSLITPELMAQYGVDAFVLGSGLSAYFFSYAIMQVGAGLCYDRFGPAKTLFCASLICALGTALIMLSEHISGLALGRLLTGVGSAAAYIGVMVVGERCFDRRYFYLIVALAGMIASLGGALGGGPIAYLIHSSSVHSVLKGLIVSGVVLAVLLLLTGHSIKDYASTHISVPKKKPVSLKKILKMPQTWAVGLYSFCNYAPICGFTALWSVPYIEARFHWSTELAASAASMTWLGIGLGSLLLGLLAQHTAAHKKVLVLCAIIGIAAFSALIWLPLSDGLIFLVFFLIGLASCGQVVSFNLIHANLKGYRLGAAFGVNNFMILISGAIMGPVVGYLLRHYWAGGYTARGVPVYTGANFQSSSSVFLLAYVLALLISLFWIRQPRAEVS